MPECSIVVKQPSHLLQFFLQQVYEVYLKRIIAIAQYSPTRLSFWVVICLAAKLFRFAFQCLFLSIQVFWHVDKHLFLFCLQTNQHNKFLTIILVVFLSDITVTKFHIHSFWYTVNNSSLWLTHKKKKKNQKHDCLLAATKACARRQL